MKTFQYWTIEKQTILIEGKPQEITCYGGSNVSIEDARRVAREKAEKIQRKIAGERQLFEEYEVEIREEVLKVIDDGAVITRNRYGAQVLNIEKLMILDIDKPIAAKGLGGLFKKVADKRSRKAEIFEMVRKLATTKYSQYGFRIYETYQGARVIVLGRDFDTRDDGTKKMMDEFNCDPLYTMLCIKQGCYRARLTPKPHRMRMQKYKVQFPRGANDVQFEQWLAKYESASRSFSVCKLVEQVGASHSLPEAVRLHDDVAGVGYPQRLA
ncbi:MAG: hypothetical protein IT314_16880 [Anaerolineales bacterium]|nr:hypothetical protein [Anaerolineales bacterium]